LARRSSGDMVESFQTHGDGGPQSVEIICSNGTHHNERLTLLNDFSHNRGVAAVTKLLRDCDCKFVTWLVAVGLGGTSEDAKRMTMPSAPFERKSTVFSD
jgi:hypothetical protein